jgi:hypothetical protein
LYSPFFTFGGSVYGEDNNDELHSAQMRCSEEVTMPKRNVAFVN